MAVQSGGHCHVCLSGTGAPMSAGTRPLQVHTLVNDQSGNTSQLEGRIVELLDKLYAIYVTSVRGGVVGFLPRCVGLGPPTCLHHVLLASISERLCGPSLASRLLKLLRAAGK